MASLTPEGISHQQQGEVASFGEDNREGKDIEDYHEVQKRRDRHVGILQEAR